MVAQAELWLMETPNDKRRPVLIVSRDDVIPVLDDVVAAPVASTIRGVGGRRQLCEALAAMADC